MKLYIRTYVLEEGPIRNREDLKNSKMTEYDEMAYNIFFSMENIDKNISNAFPELPIGSVVSVPDICTDEELFFLIESKDPLTTRLL